MDQIAKWFAEDYDDDTNHESVPIRVRRTGKYTSDMNLENVALWRSDTHVCRTLLLLMKRGFWQKFGSQVFDIIKDATRGY